MLDVLISNLLLTVGAAAIFVALVVLAVRVLRRIIFRGQPDVDGT